MHPLSFRLYPLYRYWYSMSRFCDFKGPTFTTEMYLYYIMSFKAFVSSSWPSTLDIPLPKATNRSHSWLLICIRVRRQRWHRHYHQHEWRKQQRARVVSDPLGGRQGGVTRGRRGQREHSVDLSSLPGDQHPPPGSLPLSPSLSLSPSRLTLERNSWKPAPAPWRHLRHPRGGLYPSWGDAPSRCTPRRSVPHSEAPPVVVRFAFVERCPIAMVRSAVGGEWRWIPAVRSTLPAEDLVPATTLARRHPRTVVRGERYRGSNRRRHIAETRLPRSAFTRRVDATIRVGDMVVDASHVPGLFFRQWPPVARSRDSSGAAKDRSLSLSRSLVVLVAARVVEPGVSRQTYRYRHVLSQNFV